MVKLSPACIAASVAVALAATAAIAQIPSPAAGGMTTNPAPTASPGTSSGVSQVGTSSGDAFSGSSRGNAPPVGSASVGTGLTTSTGLPAGVAANGAILPLQNPNIVGGFINPGIVDGVTDNGERLTANIGNGSVGDTSTAASGLTGATVFASNPEMDAATRRELRKERATAARGGQRLFSITPRTDVDRSHEMPDDPIHAFRPR